MGVRWICNGGQYESCIGRYGANACVVRAEGSLRQMLVVRQ